MAVGAAAVRRHVGHQYHLPGKRVPKRHPRSINVKGFDLVEVARCRLEGRRSRVQHARLLARRQHVARVDFTP